MSPETTFRRAKKKFSPAHHAAGAAFGPKFCGGRVLRGCRRLRATRKEHEIGRSKMGQPLCYAAQARLSASDIPCRMKGLVLCRINRANRACPNSRFRWTASRPTFRPPLPCPRTTARPRRTATTARRHSLRCRRRPNVRRPRCPPTSWPTCPVGWTKNLCLPDIRDSVRSVLTPLHNGSLVVAADGLNKSMGTSLTHLEWLLILEESKIKRRLSRGGPAESSRPTATTSPNRSSSSAARSWRDACCWIASGTSGYSALPDPSPRPANTSPWPAPRHGRLQHHRQRRPMRPLTLCPSPELFQVPESKRVDQVLDDRRRQAVSCVLARQSNFDRAGRRGEHLALGGRTGIGPYSGWPGVRPAGSAPAIWAVTRRSPTRFASSWSNSKPAPAKTAI